MIDCIVAINHSLAFVLVRIQWQGPPQSGESSPAAMPSPTQMAGHNTTIITWQVQKRGGVRVQQKNHGVSSTPPNACRLFLLYTCLLEGWHACRQREKWAMDNPRGYLVVSLDYMWSWRVFYLYYIVCEVLSLVMLDISSELLLWRCLSAVLQLVLLHMRRVRYSVLYCLQY